MFSWRFLHPDGKVPQLKWNKSETAAAFVWIRAGKSVCPTLKDSDYWTQFQPDRLISLHLSKKKFGWIWSWQTDSICIMHLFLTMVATPCLQWNCLESVRNSCQLAMPKLPSLQHQPTATRISESSLVAQDIA